MNNRVANMAIEMVEFELVGIMEVNVLFQNRLETVF